MCLFEQHQWGASFLFITRDNRFAKFKSSNMKREIQRFFIRLNTDTARKETRARHDVQRSHDMAMSTWILIETTFGLLGRLFSDRIFDIFQHVTNFFE
jgi:hypothetical protein